MKRLQFNQTLTKKDQNEKSIFFSFNKVINEEVLKPFSLIFLIFLFLPNFIQADPCDSCFIDRSFICDTASNNDLILIDSSVADTSCSVVSIFWYEVIGGNYSYLGSGIQIVAQVDSNATEICQKMRFIAPGNILCIDTVCKPIGCDESICDLYLDFEVIPNTNTITFDSKAIVGPSCSITAYQWDLGDGNSANTALTTHAYNNMSPESYEVCLTVDYHNPNCTQSYSETICKYVSVPSGVVFEYCDPVIDLQNTVVNISEVQASVAIISSGNIPSGNIVEMKAGSFVEFKAGFSAEGGSSLTASINPCTLCESDPGLPFVKCELVDLYEADFTSVVADLVGYVYDENDEPLSGVYVELENGATTTTDQYGHFFFEDEIMNGEGAIVTMSDPYHVTIVKMFYPVNGAESRVHAELSKNMFDKTFNAVTGGIIDNLGSSGYDLAAQAVVTFPPNAIIDGAGNLYTGYVNASIVYLDATENDTYDRMPGNLSAFNNNLEEGILKSYGMLSVELQDNSGNPLNLSPDHCASFTMKVPPAQIASAPASIALWYFDEEAGIWIEEGVAIFDAATNSYSGYICHFTWWNCDEFAEQVNLSFTLNDMFGNTAQSMHTRLSLISDPTYIGNAYTNEDGYVSGNIPSGEALLLEVLDPCGNILLSTPIGSFITDTDLGTIIIPGYELVNIAGSLVDCSAVLVENGVIITDVDGYLNLNYIETPFTNPFDLYIPKCISSTDIEVVGFDLDELLASAPATFTIVPGTIPVGTLSACGAVFENYIEFNIDAMPAVIYIDGAAIISGGTTSILGSFGGNYIAIDVPSIVDGTGISSPITVFEAFTGAGTVSVDIDFGLPGEQITGTFTGTFNEYNGGTLHTITGNFSVAE